MVLIKDIAQYCNVSSATVSKALNDQSDISEATKERIRAAAEELGYMSNSAARALKTGKTNNIGVLFIDERNAGLSHEYFSTMLEAIKAHAESYDYDITFIGSGRTMSYLQHCRYRGVDGVIIANMNYEDPRVQELVKSEIPVVVVDHDFGQKVSIMSDNEQGGRSIVRYAYEMGHRNLGIIHGELTEVTQKRLKGMMECCEELGITIPKCNIKQARFHDSTMTYVATMELLAMPNRPTCIIFPDDYSYIGGFNAIHNAGLSIPGDVSTIGYDGVELSRIISPRLVTYYQDSKAIGQKAVEKLIEQIDHPEKKIHETIEIPGYLLDGGSVREYT